MSQGKKAAQDRQIRRNRWCGGGFTACTNAGLPRPGHCVRRHLPQRLGAAVHAV